MKIYTLQQLKTFNIDNWVNALSEISDRFGHLVYGYGEDKCPADYEIEFTRLSKEGKMFFDENGTIQAWDVMHLEKRKQETGYAYETIKPCPFCGGVAEITGMNKTTFIECCECGCRTPSYDDCWDDNPIVNAVKTWNTRV
jgi:hypothetical protein